MRPRGLFQQSEPKLASSPLILGPKDKGSEKCSADSLTESSYMKTLRMDKSKSIPGFANPRCYARPLGGCCRQMSGEHYVSRAMLKLIADSGKQVLARNLPFGVSPTAPRLLDIDGKDVAPKILCVVHNISLGGYDDAGLAMLQAMKAIDDETRNQVHAEKVWSVNGDALERLILKAHLGALYAGVIH